MIDIKNCYLKDSCKKFPECEEMCIKLFKTEELYKLTLLTEKQRQFVKLLLSPNSPDIEYYQYLKGELENILNFVKEGKNLYIHSLTSGNGKTTWAIKFIQAYINKIWYSSDIKCKALFINVPRFLLELKDNISSKSEYVTFIKENVNSADLVVWDEIGTKGLTEFEFSHLLSLINTRIELNKSNIYTSNMSAEDLEQLLGSRLYSRVVNLSKEIVFNEPDKRGIK